MLYTLKYVDYMEDWEALELFKQYSAQVLRRKV